MRNITLVLAAVLAAVPVGTAQARPFATPTQERPVDGFDGEIAVIGNSAVCGSAERASGESNAILSISTADIWEAVVNVPAGSRNHSLCCSTCAAGRNGTFLSGQTVHLFLKDKEDGNESSLWLWNGGISRADVDLQYIVKSDAKGRADSARPEIDLMGSCVAWNIGAIKLHR
jgi:hypothetical protein